MKYPAKWGVQIAGFFRHALVFLPGLTADHRLFEKQTEYFENKQNVFVWDAPSHALSRPFTNNYSLSDMAEWLDEILAKEEIYNPVIIGQSMGSKGIFLYHL